MKRNFYFIFLLVIGITTSTNTHATIRRVKFTATTTPVPGIDFTTFQDAHDAASNGDTIQLYPNTLTYNSFTGTINKKLVIIGPGYNYNSYYVSGSEIPNSGLQILPGYITSNNFTIAKGSAGTSFQGINSIGINTSNIPDSLNDISIIRCKDVSVYWDNSGVCNNWIISQCYNVSTSQNTYGASFTGNRTISNLRIENCINSSSIGVNTSPVGISSGQILNCTFITPNFNFYNQAFVVQNCIMVGGIYYYSSGMANTIFINNITESANSNNIMFTNPGSAGNVFGVSFTNNAFFVGYPNNTSGSVTLYSNDARYVLSATSPAKNAGIIPGTATATDCGAFGGTNPYKVSGIPSVPSFYKLTSPSSTATSSPYTLTFSVKSNN